MRRSNIFHYMPSTLIPPIATSVKTRKHGWVEIQGCFFLGGGTPYCLVLPAKRRIRDLLPARRSRSLPQCIITLSVHHGIRIPSVNRHANITQNIAFPDATCVIGIKCSGTMNRFLAPKSLTGVLNFSVTKSARS